MKRLLVLLFAVASLSTLSNAQHQYLPARALLSVCDNATPENFLDSPKYSMCAGYISGIIEYSQGEMMWKDAAHTGIMSLDWGHTNTFQTVAAFKAYMFAHPEMLTEPAERVVFNSSWASGLCHGRPMETSQFAFAK